MDMYNIYGKAYSEGQVSACMQRPARALATQAPPSYVPDTPTTNHKIRTQPTQPFTIIVHHIIYLNASCMQYIFHIVHNYKLYDREQSIIIYFVTVI